MTTMARRIARMHARKHDGTPGAPFPAYDATADDDGRLDKGGLDAEGGPDDGELPAMVFDAPTRTELRARAVKRIRALVKDVAAGAGEYNAGGDGFDDHPSGEPNPFSDDGTWSDNAEWFMARKEADEIDNAEIATEQMDSYRRQPVVVSAVQIASPMFADTLEGRMHGNPGDWLVEGVAGERYFVKPDIFAATYEPVGSTLERQTKRAIRKDADEVSAPETVGFQGIPVIVDRPKGFVQRGTGRDGTPWERTYLFDYGYIPNTQGGDGEGLDVYLGPNADAPMSFWIIQSDGEHGFDEFKVMLGFDTVEDAADAYCAHTPPELVEGILEIPVTTLQALLGVEPTQVIEQEQPTTEATMKVTKDSMPQGPGMQPNGDETLPDPSDDVTAGSGGADIVEIAGERLQDICASMDAGGGELTDDLKAEVGAVVALLETVAPDDDDDDDDDDDENAPVDDAALASEAVTANAKAAMEKRAARKGKSLVGKMVMQKHSPESFVAACFKQLKKALSCVDKARAQKMIAGLKKSVTYGTEVFGTEAAFQSAGSDVADIPMFTEAWMTSPEDVATPALAKPGSQYAEDATYTPNENSQQAFDAGSPQIMEKRLNGVLAGIAKLTGKPAPAAAAAPPAAAAAAPPAADAAKEEPPVAKDGTGAWSAAYIAALPDDSFLYIEPGATQDAAGMTQPPTARHFPYKDKDGNVDVQQLQTALSQLAQSGLAPEVQEKIKAEAEKLLGAAASAQKSEVQKALRSDEGWVDDLATPEFMKGDKLVKTMPFGWDDLPSKALKLDPAGGAVDAK